MKTSKALRVVVVVQEGPNSADKRPPTILAVERRRVGRPIVVRPCSRIAINDPMETTPLVKTHNETSG